MCRKTGVGGPRICISCHHRMSVAAIAAQMLFGSLLIKQEYTAGAQHYLVVWFQSMTIPHLRKFLSRKTEVGGPRICISCQSCAHALQAMQSPWSFPLPSSWWKVISSCLKMELFSMEHECDEDSFHDDKTTYNYSTAPGERWNCSKIFIFEGRGYIKDYLSACGERLYLKCRRCQKKPYPCRGRAMVVGKFEYCSK